MATTVFRIFAAITLGLGFVAVFIGQKKKKAKRSLRGVVAGMLAMFLAVRSLTEKLILDLDTLSAVVLILAALVGLAGTILCLRKKEAPNQLPEPTSGLAPGRGSS